MKQITTKSGFEITVEESAADDFEVLEMLGDIDAGDYRKLRSVLDRLITTEGTKKLIEHVRTEDGRAPISAMLIELAEIVSGFGKK